MTGLVLTSEQITLVRALFATGLQVTISDGTGGGMTPEQLLKHNSVEFGATVCERNPRRLGSRRGAFNNNVSPDSVRVDLTNAYQEVHRWRVDHPDFRDAGIVDIRSILEYSFSAPGNFSLSARLSTANLPSEFEANDSLRGLPQAFTPVAEVDFQRHDANALLAGDYEFQWLFTQGLRAGSTWTQHWRATTIGHETSASTAPCIVNHYKGRSTIDPTVHKIYLLELKLQSALVLPNRVSWWADDSMLHNPRKN